MTEKKKLKLAAAEDLLNNITFENSYDVRKKLFLTLPHTEEGWQAFSAVEIQLEIVEEARQAIKELL